MALALAGTAAVATGGTGPEARRAFLLRAADQWWLPDSYAVVMLQDPYPETRAFAARALACNPDAGRLRLLGEYAADSSPGARTQALIAAGKLGAPGAGLAFAGLTDSVPLVRQAAAWAACHGGADMLEPLGRVLLTERSTAVLETTLANMWRLGDAPWEVHVARYAGHRDPVLRRAAAYSLARSASARRSAALAALCRDSEPVIRSTALAGLARGPFDGTGLRNVADALSDPDWRVRAAACAVLAARPEARLEEGAAARLAGLWTDRRVQLAVAALDAAAVHPEAGSDGALRDLAGAAEPWPAAAAARALARRGAAGAAELARDWLRSKEGWRRRAAAAAVPALPAEARRPLEGPILADPDPAVRLAWLGALDAGSAEGVAALLEGALEDDPDAAVRARALELLGAQPVDRLLELYEGWHGDEMPDARAAALAAALAATDDGAIREAVLDRAAADSDPAVAAQVVAAARRAGISAALPERPARHEPGWYEEVARWLDESHWLDVVTVRGTFRIRLDTGIAPITSREVFDLAREGFYDGLTVHRVVPNFVVQGGDPRGDGWGGPGFALPDEPSLVPFDSWRVGIATAGPNTGGCQFFVTLLPADHLTGHYTNLGEVTRGREVLTRLQVGDRIVRVEGSSGAEPPPAAPVLLDAVTWEQLASLEGWRAELESYRPDADAVARLRRATGSYEVLTVLGTWCDDSRREVPRLERVLAELPPERFDHRMVAVDRTKRIADPDFPAVAIGAVERVPTIVVRNGEGVELGRIVETASKPIERLLVEFLAGAEGW